MQIKLNTHRRQVISYFPGPEMASVDENSSAAMGRRAIRHCEEISSPAVKSAKWCHM